MNDSMSIDERSGGGVERPGTGAVAVAPPPEMSPIGRLLGVFIQPRATFESMRERPRILLPMIVLIVVQTALAFVMFQSGIVAEETTAKMEAQGRSPQEIEAVQRFFEGTPALIFTMATSPVFATILLVTLAGLAFFIGNLMLGGRLRYAHYLSAMAFGGLVLLVEQIVRVGLILASRTYDVRLGLGMLLGDATGFGVRVLDTMTDPLFLWGHAISALGIAVYARRGFGFGVASVLLGVLASVLLSATR